MIDKKYLPSKKFLMSLVVSTAIVILTIIINYWGTNTTKYRTDNVILNASSTILTADTDKDGLPDWKENLYDTNPKKPDTDTDGTNDSDEISQNRDPLKANTALSNQEPNDKIDTAIIEENKKNLDEYNKLTSTEKMARDLMSNILASQPANGGKIDQSTADYIVKKSLQDIPQKNYTGVTKESDLNLIKSANTTELIANLKKYAGDYGSETEKFRLMLTADVKLIDIYISSGKDVKKDMNKITSQYQSIVDNLIKMAVPAAATSYGSLSHLLLINDLEKLIKIDDNIIRSDLKDAANIFADLSAYSKTLNEILLILKKLDSILKITRY